MVASRGEACRASTIPEAERFPAMRSGSSLSSQFLVALGLLTWGTCGGCASVSVRKVPSPAQYKDWNDDLQKQADAMEGVRFYLPRPWVNVFESFPIATDVYLASGMVSPDGRYVIVTQIVPATSAAELETPKGGKIPNLTVPSDWIFPAQRDAEARDGQGVPRSEPEPQGDGKEPEQPVEQPQEEPEEPEQPRTGQNQRSVTNDNGAFAYQPMRGNMDLVYLPDFDEQYVASSKANLGNAEFQLNLGQGWSLQGFNSLADNFELNKRLYALIDKASEMATQIASAGTSRLVDSINKASEGLARPRSGTDLVTAKGQGSQVTLKIVVVHYAAKGLYPVIKPRELMGSVKRPMLLNLQEQQPLFRGSLTSAQVEYAVDRFDALQRRFTVPIYPYQYLSFNTFRYMAIEVLSPNGAPFGNLYDKTGTQGEAGDRQAADLADEIRRLLGKQAPDKESEEARQKVLAARKSLGEFAKKLPGLLTPKAQAHFSSDNDLRTVEVKNVALEAAGGNPATQITARVQTAPVLNNTVQDKLKLWLKTAIETEIKADTALGTAIGAWADLPVEVKF